jgi:hypothetical protein
MRHRLPPARAEDRAGGNDVRHRTDVEVDDTDRSFGLEHHRVVGVVVLVDDDRVEPNLIAIF